MGIERRQFIKLAGVIGGGLVLGFSLPACIKGNPNHSGRFPDRIPGSWQPNAFLQLTAAGEIVLQLHKVEMGQGTMTGLTTLVAEELNVWPELITLRFAQVHQAYVDPDLHMMATGGSSSIRTSYELLREAAATMREMILRVAARQWGLTTDDCHMENFAVMHKGGEQSVSIRILIDALKQEPVPEQVALKPRSEFRFIGRVAPRLDGMDKVLGKVRYATDMTISKIADGAEIATAVLVRCPRFGGKVEKLDDSKARQHAGVSDILVIDSGVAVVAGSYWQARQAAEKLQIQWIGGLSPELNDVAIKEKHYQLLAADDSQVVRDEKAVKQHPANLAHLEADYTLPYLAHATMEPQNATIWLSGGACEVWAPTQGPDVVQGVVAKILELPKENVFVHSPLLGGGFGRRICVDYVREAAEIVKASGRSICLVWSREDDIRHDCYRPASMARMRAALDQNGAVLNWQHRIVSPSIMRQMVPRVSPAVVPGWMPELVAEMSGELLKDHDESTVEGAKDIPYAFDGIRVDHVFWDPQIPIGYWRSVGHSANAFVVESFVDELAYAAGQDPYLFRRANLKQQDRHLGVLDRVVELSGWKQHKQGKDGRYRGIAVHKSFQSYVAQVVEITLADTVIQVEKVYCVIDCGLVVNPDIVVAQMESAIVFGLTAALKGSITIEAGAVVQSNFHDLEILRMHETPEIEVALIDSDQAPTGVGEPGLPPLAPALANAVFAATGKRLRELPLRLA